MTQGSSSDGRCCTEHGLFNLTLWCMLQMPALLKRNEMGDLYLCNRIVRHSITFSIDSEFLEYVLFFSRLLLM